MKVFFIERGIAAGMSAQRRQAFTLTEMLITLGLFVWAVAGIISVFIFGLKQNELILSKLGASDQSRIGFDLLARDVRSAKIWQVGNGSFTGFTGIPNGTVQQGTALQLNFTTDTNAYVRYYFDTTACELRRMHSGDSSYKRIAQYLTNSMYFQAQTFKGVTQTDLSHKGVVYVVLQFCQYQYPLIKVGPGYYYDSYQIQFRLSPHVPDGP